MPYILRIALGFVLAAIWLPSVFFAAYLFTQPSYANWIFVLLASFMGGLTIVVAVPIFLVMILLRKRITLVSCAISGVAVGVIGTFLRGGPWVSLQLTVAFATVGVASSMIFWTVAIWKNPKLTGETSNGRAAS